MKRVLVLVSFVLLLSALTFAQSTHLTSSSTLPASCRVGDVYYKSGASAGLYACSDVDVWTGPYGASGGSSGGGGVSAYVIKTTNETVTSSTTLQDDDELTLHIGASEKHLYQFQFLLDATTAADIKFALVCPAGATGWFGGHRMGGNAADTADEASNWSAGTALDGSDFRVVGGGGAGAVFATPFQAYVVNSTTAGNCKLQWAQNSSSGTGSIVKAGSVMLDTQVSGLSIGRTEMIRKASDETVTSSVTLQDDDALLFSIGASETHTFRFVAFVDAGTTGDFKFTVTVPASATGYIGHVGLASTVSATQGDVSLGATATFGTAFTNIGGAGSGTPVMVICEGIVINSTTAGSVKLQWAQNTSDGTGSIVKTNSYVTHTRFN